VARRTYSACHILDYFLTCRRFSRWDALKRHRKSCQAPEDVDPPAKDFGELNQFPAVAGQDGLFPAADAPPEPPTGQQPPDDDIQEFDASPTLDRPLNWDLDALASLNLLDHTKRMIANIRWKGELEDPAFLRWALFIALRHRYVILYPNGCSWFLTAAFLALGG
jgi:hypothetical protein